MALEPSGSGHSILMPTLLFTNVSFSKVVAAGGSWSAQHVGPEMQQSDTR